MSWTKDDYKEYLISVCDGYIEMERFDKEYINEFKESIENAEDIKQLELLCKITDSWLDY